jgi:uncharacterized membrane protein YgcG
MSLPANLPMPPASSRLPRRITRALLALGVLLLAAAPVLAVSPRPGPPWPDPILNQAVYDYAGVFQPSTVASVESTIDAIEARTGAEIVVYTQVVGFSETPAEAEANALDLLNTWGVGRKGFDDGMVILFDLDNTRKHGQVQLYAAEGYRAVYLSNDERQKIYDNDMLPRLKAGDLDGAILAAMAKIDAAATPDHAAKLQTARQLDAAVGLIGGPIVLILMVGLGVRSWLRTGKDPVYLDDDSVLMAGPPPRLTAAAAAALLEGDATRRALTTAMLDLASRGQLAFREQKKLLGLGATKVGIDTNPPAGDEVTEAHRALNARRPLGDAEQFALEKLRSLADDGLLEADEVPKFGTYVGTFDSKLEDSLAANGWMTESPGKVTGRWVLRGFLGLFGGIVIVIAAFNLPSAGLTIVGGAAIAGGVFLLILSGVMPAATKDGAMVRAQLKAYRRTLQKTMAQARSMQQVVDQAGLTWLETPDQAVVWGTALGLQSEIEGVLARSLEDVQAGRATYSGMYFPIWYTNSAGQSFGSLAGSGGGGGLFSSSPIPNIGGMMSALGTIGNSPSSSGSGGGGFGGGGSGGGGGAGGGF